MQLKVVQLSEIFEGTRFRKDYGDLDALKKSIQANGIIQPIAVGMSDKYPNDTDGKQLVLIAGGRRFRAATSLGLTDVPVRIYNRELTENQLRSIELEENVQRKDMTWQEALNLEKEIHELQIAIKGPKVSTAADASGHSMRDTANMLGKSHASVSQDLKLSNAMTKHPDMPWDKCKNKHEASKLMCKVCNIVETKILATMAQKTIGLGSKRLKQLSDSYITRNCIEAMKEFPSKTFNFAEVDPPYGIDLKGNKQNYAYDEYVEVPGKEYAEFLTTVCTELYRIMADNSWTIFWFAPHPWFESVYQTLTDAGFNTSRMCGIWNKPNGQTNHPTERLGNAYEMFFYARKGRPLLAKPGRINTFNFSPVPPEQKTHPAERPVPLIREILKTFAKPNSRVIVPFAGSGNTLLAASQEDMIPVGYDLVGDFKDQYVINITKELGSSDAEQ